MEYWQIWTHCNKSWDARAAKSIWLCRRLPEIRNEKTIYNIRSNLIQFWNLFFVFHIKIYTFSKVYLIYDASFLISSNWGRQLWKNLAQNTFTCDYKMEVYGKVLLQIYLQMRYVDTDNSWSLQQFKMHFIKSAAIEQLSLNSPT